MFDFLKNTAVLMTVFIAFSATDVVAQSPIPGTANGAVPIIINPAGPTRNTPRFETNRQFVQPDQFPVITGQTTNKNTRTQQQKSGVSAFQGLSDPSGFVDNTTRSQPNFKPERGSGGLFSRGNYLQELHQAETSRAQNISNSYAPSPQSQAFDQSSAAVAGEASGSLAEAGSQDPNQQSGSSSQSSGSGGGIGNAIRRALELQNQNR